MKAKVKDMAIRYNGKRYEKGEVLVIDQKYFSDELFACLDLKDNSEEKVEDTKAKK